MFVLLVVDTPWNLISRSVIQWVSSTLDKVEIMCLPFRNAYITLHEVKSFKNQFIIPIQCISLPINVNYLHDLYHLKVVRMRWHTLNIIVFVIIYKVTNYENLLWNIEHCVLFLSNDIIHTFENFFKKVIWYLFDIYRYSLFASLNLGR